jgi:hypothetical protein
VTDAKPDAAPTAKKKKKQSVASMQRELRDLAKPAAGTPEKPPVDFKKLFVRVGGVLLVVWILAIFLVRWLGMASVIGAGVLTVAGAGVGVWLVRYVKKTQELGALLRNAGDSEEGRQEALKRLETDYKKGDVQASIAPSSRCRRTRARRWRPWRAST